MSSKDNYKKQYILLVDWSVIGAMYIEVTERYDDLWDLYVKNYLHILFEKFIKIQVKIEQ